MVSPTPNLNIAVMGKKTGDEESAVLVVNGSILENSHAYQFGNKLHGYIYDPEDSKLVTWATFTDIKRSITSLYLAHEYPWNTLISGVEFSFANHMDLMAGHLRFEFGADGEDWTNPYSLNDYGRALAAAALNHNVGLAYYQEDEFLSSGFGLDCEIRLMDNMVVKEIAHWADQVHLISKTAMELVTKNVRKDSVVAFFDFPLPVKAACEQYLVYFAQFLSDLGIHTDSEIKEDAGRVLFSITPKEGPSALGRIKEALDIYLDLPGNSEFSAEAVQFTDIAVTQLKSQVFFLQSQLELARATMQAKDAAILALDFTVFRQRKLLDAGGRSYESVSAKDEEPILGKAVQITTYEGKGFKVNLPHILRQLKRKFGFGLEKSDHKIALPPVRDQK